MHSKELAQLTNKLWQQAVTLQPLPTPKPREDPLHMAMQKYTDTLCVTQCQTNLTMSLLQDILTFNRWDTTKMEDWLSNI